VRGGLFGIADADDDAIEPDRRGAAAVVRDPG
jgi:hypothetical protein